MSDDLAQFAMELFEPMGGVSLRKMFGGHGFFKSGLMFALIYGDEIYLKADDEAKGPYEDEDAKQFLYEGKNKTTAMGYWTVPERLLDDADEFNEWAKSAFEVALRVDAAKPPSQRKLKY